jgi:hypothetical protein
MRAISKAFMLRSPAGPANGHDRARAAFDEDLRLET